MAGAYKTPGVYIVEKDAFPNSVVEVATAVPAFIGYTEFANNKGKPLLNKPWRISSMAEYLSYFGGPPTAEFNIYAKSKKPEADALAVPKGKPAADAGAAAAPTVDSTPTAPAAANDPSTLAKVAVAGIKGTDKNSDPFSFEEEDFAYGKTDKYFLTLNNPAYHLLYRSILLFFQNGGGPCYIVSVGNYSNEMKASDLSAAFELLKKEQEPTMIVVPEAVCLPEAECIGLQQAALNHCGYDMKNRFAILDIYGGFADNRDNACIDKFRNSLASNFSAFGATYYPWLHTSIVSVSDLSFLNIHADSLPALVSLLTLEVLESEASPKKKDSIIAEINKLPGVANNTPVENNELHKTLVAVSGLYNKVLSAVQLKLNVLPPSAAMAGVFTMVDNTRGVWKAPANVGLTSVSAPVINISGEEQEELNVSTTGKSINAIRAFIGEGTLVWGARTLDGNSLDWRYINVRRTMIMLEESVKLATKAYVFEPNTANTWVTIKSMISNFLTSVWKRGGLAGAVPDDAFSVHVGLGETMTAEDILEGILRVTIFVAISRPAEFIEITFQQQLQKS